MMYLTGQNLLGDLKASGDEETNSIPLVDERIERKVHKYIDQNEEIMDQYGLDKETVKDLVCNVVGSFCLYRLDIGFISGLEKLATQFAFIYMQRTSFEEEEPF